MAPKTFTSYVFLNSSRRSFPQGWISNNGFDPGGRDCAFDFRKAISGLIPALLMRISSLPYFCSTYSTAELMEVSSVTSRVMGSMRVRVGSRVEAEVWPLDLSREQRMMCVFGYVRSCLATS